MKGIKSKSKDVIYIEGAKTHNLKNISLKIPKNKFIVISGVSGSGKSSLAFNTLFAEGQRRYIESLSSYARQFLGKLKKPEVDNITGICPAIAVEQKTITNNPRSTVATITEIYDYLKLLFSRIGKTISPISNTEVKRHQLKDIVEFIKTQKESILILIEKDINNLNDIRLLKQQGFSRIILKGNMKKINEIIQYETDITNQKIQVVIDRVLDDNHDINRVTDSIQTALFEGEGKCILQIKKNDYIFSDKFEMDGIQFEKPTTYFFDFNNPYGACKKCEGYGSILGIDEDKVIVNKNHSVYQDAINCWKGKKLNKWKEKFMQNSEKFNFPIHRPYYKLTKEEKEILWNGKDDCKGIYQFFEKLESDKYKIQNRVLIARYRGKRNCDECGGSRLRKDALYVKVDNKNISQILEMSINDALTFFTNIKLTDNQKIIAKRILKEIRNRLKYLNELGLGYLTLTRRSNTLSGGETQRINLATSIGSALVGAMYILDEPSIGLHSQDTKRLIKILKELRDLGNTVIVVEHDEEIMIQADQIIDIGPKAGVNGGKIIFQGSVNDIYKKPSLTTKYLSGEFNISIPKYRNIKINDFISIKGINKYNLKNINIKIPLNTLTLITGMSGSGKSTLVKEIIKPAVENYLQKIKTNHHHYKKIDITSINLKKIEFINQKPIGRSSRSNPITYIKAYDDIRRLFANQALAKQREYKAGHFSFNVDGGRCESCKGEGEITIEMQFMSDVHIQCDSCKGKRFKEEILEIKIQEKNIADILDLSVDQAINFFEENDQIIIAKKIKPLIDVGLGYVKLGQSSNTLSGGEAQRIKLASFLGKGETADKILFIFDEPTTGLHFHDIKKLLSCFYQLIEKGNSIICIEHNLDVIKCADWIIDLGPEGGNKGGKIMFEGYIKNFIQSKKSITAKYLKSKINNQKNIKL